MTNAQSLRKRRPGLGMQFFGTILLTAIIIGCGVGAIEWLAQ